MTDRQRLKENKRIKKYYGKKRKAEQNGCACFVCKYFNERNGRCLKRREKPKLDGVWT